jgi:hypothetical protein
MPQSHPPYPAAFRTAAVELRRTSLGHAVAVAAAGGPRRVAEPGPRGHGQQSLGPRCAIGPLAAGAGDPRQFRVFRGRQGAQRRLLGLGHPAAPPTAPFLERAREHTALGL